MIDDRVISRREFAGIAAAAVGARGLRSRFPTPWDGYEEAMVIDALASPAEMYVPNGTAAPLRTEVVANARASGITGVNLTVSGRGAGFAAFESTVRSIAFWERELATHADVFRKITAAAHLPQAKTSKRMGLVYGFQGGSMFQDDLDRLDTFYHLGVRIIQPTYNQRNLLGDGCLEPNDAGLSRLGHAAVERMNSLGVLVDWSHCGTQTTADGIAASRIPMAITHSGCRSVYPHPRNKSDREMRALADRGGVFGVYMMPFLTDHGQASAEDFLRHLEHALQVCGEDHVGVGTDHSTTPIVVTPEYERQFKIIQDQRQRLGIAAPRETDYTFIPEFNQPTRMELVADRLLARGHSVSRVEKVLGKNFERLFAAVWK